MNEEGVGKGVSRQDACGTARETRALRGKAGCPKPLFLDLMI